MKSCFTATMTRSHQIAFSDFLQSSPNVLDNLDVKTRTRFFDTVYLHP